MYLARVSYTIGFTLIYPELPLSYMYVLGGLIKQ